MCLRNAIDSKSNISTKEEINLIKKSYNNNKRIVKPKLKSRISILGALFIVLALLSSIALVSLYIRYNRPKKPCLRLNLNRGGNKNFHRLHNASGTNATSEVNEENEEDTENYDELNGYEYDDEFEMSENKTAAQANRQIYNSSNENLEIKVVNSQTGSLTLTSLKNKSLKQIKRLKNSILNRDLIKNGLLNVTNVNHPHFSSYSYNSTDSTLVQTKIPNEFEIKSDLAEQDDEKLGVKVSSVITYDVKNKKSKPTLLDKSSELNSDALLQNQEESKCFRTMRVSTNPLDKLDLDGVQENTLASTREQTDSGESNA